MTKVLLACLLVFCRGSISQSQQQLSDATLTFHFQRAGMPVPEYSFIVHENGSATYTATYTAPANTGQASRYAPAYLSQATAGRVAAPEPTTRAITLSAVTTAHLFERIRSTNLFQAPCESRAKNIADSGAKTLTYSGPEGNARCTYNYTENKAIAAVTETFQGIAETLDEGRSIDLKHRFDRLGLDHELALLADEVREGHALEIATIAPVLQSLTEDPQVMDRVRKRAAGLLQASAPNR